MRLNRLTTLSLLALAIPAFAQTTGTLEKVKASGTIDDLKGKTVVSTTGTTNYQILRNLNAPMSPELIESMTALSDKPAT